VNPASRIYGSMQLSSRCGAIAKPPMWADFYTVENRPTAEQAVGVLEVVEPVACRWPRTTKKR
jgi:hypothetical protein